MNRLTDLQNMFRLSNRMIGKNTTMNDLESMKTIDWNRVDSVIAEKRLKSKSYLEKALGIA